MVGFPLQPDQADKAPDGGYSDQFLHKEVVLVAGKEKKEYQQDTPGKGLDPRFGHGIF